MTVFADAAYYIATANRRDALHDVARRLAVTTEARVVTTEYVLLEVGNFLARSSDRSYFVNLLK